MARSLLLIGYQGTESYIQEYYRGDDGDAANAALKYAGEEHEGAVANPDNPGGAQQRLRRHSRCVLSNSEETLTRHQTLHRRPMEYIHVGVPTR